MHKSFLEKTCESRRQRQGHRWKSLWMVCQHLLSKHSRFWPNFANQSSTGSGQHWFERFQGIKWLVGGVSQAPRYTILFVVWKKCWNGRKCCQPLETKLAQHYSRLWHKGYLECGQNWTSLERCAKPQLGTARKKVQSREAGQGETYHCSFLFSNWWKI